MLKNPIGNSQYLKRYNRANVLNIIRKKEYASRIDIAKESKLTPTAVTDIVNDLLGGGFIRETGLGQSTGGRKPVMLELNPQFFYVLGVDIDERAITMVLVDFACKVVAKQMIKTHDVMTYSHVLDVIRNMSHDVLKRSGVDSNRVLGMGVGVTGQVNRREGTVLFSPNFGWKNVSLAKDLRQQHPWPIFVDNEARATAMAEFWIGYGSDVDNFININARTGIGSGIFVNGQPYFGVTESAGEIGHTTVNENGPRCSCGNNGCLEVFASTPSIEKRMFKIIQEGRATQLKKIIKDDFDNLTLDAIIKCAREGDGECIRLLEETGHYIGIGISNLINILNPKRIILGGDICLYGELVIKKIRETIESRSLYVPRRVVDIVISRLGTEGPAVGAATLVLWKAFQLSKELPGLKGLFEKGKNNDKE